MLFDCFCLSLFIDGAVFFYKRAMSNNRYYKHYLNTILDAVGTQTGIKKFSAAYKLMLQKKFNYNFSLFRSSNGIFVYGAAFVLFGAKPDRVISSRSLRSKKRYGIAVSALKNEHSFANKRKRFFRGLERFSVSVLANRGAYGYMDFLPLNNRPTHLNVFSKGVSVNPEMVNLC